MENARRLTPANTWSWLGVAFALLSFAGNVWLVHNLMQSPDYPLCAPPTAQERTK
jgi:hypothetical protein